MSSSLVAGAVSSALLSVRMATEAMLEPPGAALVRPGQWQLYLVHSLVAELCSEVSGLVIVLSPRDLASPRLELELLPFIVDPEADVEDSVSSGRLFSSKNSRCQSGLAMTPRVQS
jgi:hypothetical protein